MDRVIETATRRLNSTATDTSLKDVTLIGIFVASSSSGTLALADDDGTIVATFSAAAATFYRIPFACRGTLTITTGGTINYTAFYN